MCLLDKRGRDLTFAWTARHSVPLDDAFERVAGHTRVTLIAY